MSAVEGGAQMRLDVSTDELTVPSPVDSTGGRGRQPVVIIHGIGEQQPGTTLRGSAKSVMANDGDGLLNKPDIRGPLRDARRFQAFATERRPRTDFYEMYWADLVRDTTSSQVRTWFLALLRRRPWSVPSAFKWLWWCLYLLVVATVVTLGLSVYEIRADGVTHWWATIREAKDGILWSLIATVVTGTAGGFLRLSLGDAARYLEARPDNISIRSAIRDRGLDLLRGLHEDRRYDRIVLIGHSLGSVIAYDIIRLLWIERSMRPVTSAALLPLRRIEDLCYPNGTSGDRDLDLEAFRQAQDDLRPFSFGDGSIQRRMHHAAAFAATRWTNLYFPTRGLVFGDPVGGALQGQFGKGIQDLPVWHPSWWRRRTPKSHSSYWHSTEDYRAAITRLRAAIDLERTSRSRNRQQPKGA